MVCINDLTYERLEAAMVGEGFPKYRAEQIFAWLSKGATDFNEMSNISKELKNELKSKYFIKNVKIEKIFHSNIDETIKYLIKLDDGNFIESVRMKYKHGNTICISTQVGCRMGCVFCASTLGGKTRDLTPAEMIGQVLAVQSDAGDRMSNIVLMGMGEPLDNYQNVVDFLKIVNHPQGLNIGYRHISLSTCGLVDKIDALAGEGLPITLSVSLHAPDDETRNILMPINRKYGVDALLAACWNYTKITKRRISFEYILIAGQNDSAEQAELLARKIKGMLCHVNLIPANNVDECGIKKSSESMVRAFYKTLGDRGINVTIRRELGADISASCGQLRQRSE